MREPPSETPTPPAHRDDFDAQVEGIAALGEPVRRALYRYVAAQDGPVTRDQAAVGVGVARHVAKFHLDKLIDDGLLDADFSRPPGRGGPGAGRPAKLYRRSARELSVSLPERRYDLAGRLFAEAITDAERAGTPVGEALGTAARNAGHALGDDARRRAGPRPRRGALLTATVDVLRECGYEPRSDASGLTLANCPFHALAQDYTDLVCGMNLELMEGLTDELGPVGLDARLDPAPERCCVRLATPKAPASERPGGSPVA